MTMLLEDFLGEEKREHYIIENDWQADKAIRKIARLRREIEENNLTANYEKERIEHWRATEEEGRNKEIEYQKSLIRPYFEGKLADSDKKSFKLPGGTASFKKQQPEIVKNDETLLPFVKANNPENIKVAESVDWANFKKELEIPENGGNPVLTMTGEVVECIQVIPREDKFEVK